MRGGRGRGKEPELPDLNKVNFPAIWSVFRMEGKSLLGCRSRVVMASFSLAVYAKTFCFLSRNPHRLFKGRELETLCIL